MPTTEENLTVLVDVVEPAGMTRPFSACPYDLTLTAVAVADTATMKNILLEECALPPASKFFYLQLHPETGTSYVPIERAKLPTSGVMRIRARTPAVEATNVTGGSGFLQASGGGAGPSGVAATPGLTTDTNSARIEALERQAAEQARLAAEQARLAAEQARLLGEQACQLREQACELGQLKLEIHKASRTSRTDADVGQEYQKTATSIAADAAALPLISLTENSELVKTAIAEVQATFPLAEGSHSYASAVFKRPGKSAKRQREETAAEEGEDCELDEEELEKEKQELPSWENVEGMTLADATFPASTSGSFKEDPGMQAAVMKLLCAVRRSIGHIPDVACPVDTHSSSKQFHGPGARPDCTSFPDANAPASWPLAVAFWEFKLTRTKPEQDALTGQLAQRCAAALAAQPGRAFILGVGITMNTIEVFVFRREPSLDKTSPSHAPLHMSSTGPHTLNVSATSTGFQLLVRVLATPMHQQGFQAVLHPNLPILGGFYLQDMQLLRQGGTGDSSFVYKVKAVRVAGGPSGDESSCVAILKLNKRTWESQLLETLRGMPNMIQLLEHGPCAFKSCAWDATLLEPYVEHLAWDSPLKLFAKVLYDVAGAIDAAAAKNILQCDITPGNFGYDKERNGVLMDFSAGKDLSKEEQQKGSPTAALTAITGTMMYASYAVLCGQPHTVSSCLEGLFISAVSISCDGKMHGLSSSGRQDRKVWQGIRMAQFGVLEMHDLVKVAKDLRELVMQLHDLFWEVKNLSRIHQQEITADQFRAVCQKFL